MSTEIALVGDIHGQLVPLRALWEALCARRIGQVVFLGDYINKGNQSSQVMSELLAYSNAGNATLLRGNHEAALMEAVDTGDLRSFLKMGGAATIRSYVGGDVGRDVIAEFTRHLPPAHLEAIRRMPETYEIDNLLAQHRLPVRRTSKFLVSAHLPTGPLPRIRKDAAQIDTGCGNQGGRLTAFLWPSLSFIQSDEQGIVTHNS